MRTVSRRGFSTGMLALLGGACGQLADDEAAPAAATPSTGAGPFADAGNVPGDAGLVFGPVDLDSALPSVVWSWTTPAQAAEIRAGKVLFTVESSPTMGRGYLFDVLLARAKAGDEAAVRLAGPELATGRFGWSNPWATVLGATDGESYGLELLAIRMKRDTIYARVSTLDPTISFVDASGNAVSSKLALATFDKVGGILFDNDSASGLGCGTFGTVGTGAGGGNLVYREIYLGNETQIASFSHRTEENLAAIEASRSSLVALRDSLGSAAAAPPRTPLEWACATFPLWRGATPEGAIEAYLASLAFATARYDPTVDNLDALITELERARFTPDPFVVTL